MNTTRSLIGNKNILHALSAKAILGQLLFVAIALLMPTITHRLSLDYSLAQPMHWMVLFAGLAYGGISGALIGAAVPVLSHLITGMPFLPVLPLMILELATYGFVAGALKKKFTGFGSVAVALIAGRAVFFTLALLLGRISVPFVQFITATWAPGIPAMLLQLAMLPILSAIYIRSVGD